MKKNCLLIFILLFATTIQAQIKPFKFAFISDTHIGSPNGAAEEDLRRTVADINQMKDIAFVVITGDITELGMNEEIKLAKKILDSLHIKYYIIPGNHDTGWSESGAVTFSEIFGDDKFLFNYNGIVFMACASGPYLRMSDGHIPRDAINWMHDELQKIDVHQPLIFLNHYPIDNSLDNWYEAIDALKTHNTIAILCGHGHNNHAYNFEDIPATMGRSNLRAKENIGGYNIVEVNNDSIIFSERKPGVKTLPAWRKIKIEDHHYQTSAKKYERPSYAVNDTFNNAKTKWTFSSDANIISTPAANNQSVIFGNSKGVIQSINIIDGKKQWSYATGASIYSSPAIQKEKMVVGSGNEKVYCLNVMNGKLIWQFAANAAVLGSPLIENNIVYIGASDHHFYAIDLNNGKQLWSFDGLDGPVMSTPVINNNKIIFGAWDRNLYALNKTTGQLIWKWNNGSSIRNYSPAACIPVIKDSIVFVVAPDRFISAININNGNTLWRSNEATVRESIGISEDGKWIYGKTMNDTIVAFEASAVKQKAAWKMSCGFGYEHVPNMLIEKNGIVFFGTKNGKVYAINPKNQTIIWVHKVDNSMINTVKVIDEHHIIASTMDGKVEMIEFQ